MIALSIVGFFLILLLTIWASGQYKMLATLPGKVTNIDAKIWGSIVAGLVVIISLTIYFSSSKKNKRDEIKPVEMVDTHYQQTTPTASVSKSLKAGEWSEWANVMTSVLHVWPSSAKVEYECKDVDGNISLKSGKSIPGQHNWNDLTQFTRVRSKEVNIMYSIEKCR